MNKSTIVLIGGGSASGKTYISNIIKKELNENNVVHICIDDYYKDLSHLSMEERNKINYDSPDSFDWPLLFNQLNDLKNGKSIKKPLYDYSIHNRCKNFELIEPKKIIIVEGIMALVKEEIRNSGNLKIFVNASDKTRFERRFRRDKIERGRSSESIIAQYNNQVMPVFISLIKPTMNYADIIINNEDNDNSDILKLIKILKQYL